MALRVNTKIITELLHKLGAQAHTIRDDGTPVTRDEALTELIYKYALGWTETYFDIDKNGNKVKKEIRHPPAPWAIQYVVERREGKAAPAMPEENTGLKASAKVRELSKQRINALAKSAKKPLPPVPLPKAP
jgi:hypothetical protein